MEEHTGKREPGENNPSVIVLFSLSCKCMPLAKNAKASPKSRAALMHFMNIMSPGAQRSAEKNGSWDLKGITRNNVSAITGESF